MVFKVVKVLFEMELIKSLSRSFEQETRINTQLVEYDCIKLSVLLVIAKRTQRGDR